MKRCHSCAHWEPNNEGLPIRLRLCSKAMIGRGEEIGDQRSVALCMGEGIEGELFTRDDFGCIEWKEGSVLVMIARTRIVHRYECGKIAHAIAMTLRHLHNRTKYDHGYYQKEIEKHLERISELYERED